MGGKNVLEIQQELMRVAAAAQQGKLQLADIQALPNEKNETTKRRRNEKHEHVNIELTSLQTHKRARKVLEFHQKTNFLFFFVPCFLASSFLLLFCFSVS